MESMKFEKRHIDLDVYGEKVKVFYPTKKHVNEYMQGLKLIIDGESNKTDMDLVIDMFEKLGLSKELSESMEIQQLSELSNKLLEQKKS